MVVVDFEKYLKKCNFLMLKTQIILILYTGFEIDNPALAILTRSYGAPL
jgi:hypothetical protein